MTYIKLWTYVSMQSKVIKTGSEAFWHCLTIFRVKKYGCKAIKTHYELKVKFIVLDLHFKKLDFGVCPFRRSYHILTYNMVVCYT